MGRLFRLRNHFQNKVHVFEGRIQDAGNPLSRAFFGARLFTSYIGLAICYSVSLVGSSSTQSFSFVNNMDPHAGYTVSYSQHRSMQRNIRVGAFSSLIVIVIINILNGVFIAQQQTRAADDAISSVAVSINNTDPDVYSEYVVDFTTTETIESGSGPSGLLHVYFTNASGTYDDSVTPFAEATLSEGMTTISGSSLAPPIEGDVDGEITAVRIGETIEAGSYRVVLNNVHNPPEGGTFRLALSSVGLPTAPATYSDTFAIGNVGSDSEENNSNPEEDNSNDSDSESDEEDTTVFSDDDPIGSGMRTTVVGDDVLVEWDAYSSADSYTLRYQINSSALQEQTGITENSTLLTSIGTSADLTLQLFAIVDSQYVALSSATETQTESFSIEQKKYTKPKVPKKKRKKKKVLVKWTAQDNVTSYTLQILNGKRKKIRTVKNIASSKTKKQIKKLKPGKKYFARVKATYITGKSGQFSKRIKFRTKK